MMTLSKGYLGDEIGIVLGESEVGWWLKLELVQAVHGGGQNWKHENQIKQILTIGGFGL